MTDGGRETRGAENSRREEAVWQTEGFLADDRFCHADHLFLPGRSSLVTLTNKPFSRRMLESRKRTGSGTHSYKWKHRATPWKVFIDTLAAPQKTTLALFGNKRFVLGTVAVIIMLGGTVMAQGPLFHSQIRNPAYGVN